MLLLENLQHIHERITVEHGSKIFYYPENTFKYFHGDFWPHWENCSLISMISLATGPLHVLTLLPGLSPLSFLLVDNFSSSWLRVSSLTPGLVVSLYHWLPPPWDFSFRASIPLRWNIHLHDYLINAFHLTVYKFHLGRSSSRQGPSVFYILGVYNSPDTLLLLSHFSRVQLCATP